MCLTGIHAGFSSFRCGAQAPWDVFHENRLQGQGKLFFARLSDPGLSLVKNSGSSVKALETLLCHHTLATLLFFLSVLAVLSEASGLLFQSQGMLSTFLFS